MKEMNQNELKEACKRLNDLIDKKDERSVLRDKAVLKQSRKVDRLIVRNELLKE
ncbi:MAG: hypothetical protein WDA65_03370 [Christensenellales bacterium]